MLLTGIAVVSLLLACITVFCFDLSLFLMVVVFAASYLVLLLIAF